MPKYDLREYPLQERLDAYENGELELPETVELFQYMLDTGLAWNPPRTAGPRLRELLDVGDGRVVH
jgi:hypothetical protein